MRPQSVRMLVASWRQELQTLERILGVSDREMARGLLLTAMENTSAKISDGSTLTVATYLFLSLNSVVRMRSNRCSSSIIELAWLSTSTARFLCAKLVEDLAQVSSSTRVAFKKSRIALAKRTRALFHSSIAPPRKLEGDSSTCWGWLGKYCGCEIFCYAYIGTFG